MHSDVVPYSFFPAPRLPSLHLIQLLREPTPICYTFLQGGRTLHQVHFGLLHLSRWRDALTRDSAQLSPTSSWMSWLGKHPIYGSESWSLLLEVEHAISGKLSSRQLAVSMWNASSSHSLLFWRRRPADSGCSYTVLGWVLTSWNRERWVSWRTHARNRWGTGRFPRWIQVKVEWNACWSFLAVACVVLWPPPSCEWTPCQWTTRQSSCFQHTPGEPQLSHSRSQLSHLTHRI